MDVARELHVLRLGVVAYADALSNELWALWDLGADFAVAGTLRVFTPAAGLISWRLAPPVT